MPSALIVNDFQWPHILPGAMDQLLADLDAIRRVDQVIFAGDILDLASVGRYRTKIEDEIEWEDAVRAGLDEVAKPILRTVTHDRVVWLDGNHEERIERYVSDRAPHLHGLVLRAWRDLLPGEYVPYDEGYRVAERILVRHGTRALKLPGSSARGEAETAGDTHVLMGHCHRLALVWEARETGSWIRAELGHLCDQKTVPKSRRKFLPWTENAGTLISWNDPSGIDLRVQLNPVRIRPDGSLHTWGFKTWTAEPSERSPRPSPGSSPTGLFA